MPWSPRVSLASQNRELMDRAGYWDDLRDLAPEVAAELERRLGVGRDRAYDYDAIMTLWPRVEGRPKAEGSTAYLDGMAADAEGRAHSWGEKLEIGGPEVMVFRPSGGGTFVESQNAQKGLSSQLSGNPIWLSGTLGRSLIRALRRVDHVPSPGMWVNICCAMQQVT